MVVPRLARQAVAGQSLSVFGDGQQSRCFCHVEDVVRALVALLELHDAVGNVFNVGSTQEITILDLAQRVIDAAGSSSGIDLIPYESAYAEGFEDMRRRVPDTTKLHDLTGWEPRRSLDDILADAIADARRAQLREGVVDLTLEEALDAHAALSAEPRRFDSDDRDATDESRQRAG
jgi:UDP-glucose 4-epimerase